MIGLDYFEWQAARALHRQDVPFYALIAAALWKADTYNANELRHAFPDTCALAQKRYDAPGGLLDSDPPALREKVLAGEIA
jgi:hypothetical protein